MAKLGGHGECPGCQLCIEYMLEAQYGPEWWNHIEDPPPPPVEFLRLVDESEPPE